MKKEERDTFDTASSVQAFIGWRETVLAKQYGLGDYGKARAEVYQERARKMKLEREQLEGSLAPLSDTKVAWSRIVVLVRNQFMGLPTKSAPLLVNLKTPMQAQAILTPMVNEILQNLSETEVVADRPRPGRAKELHV